MKTFDKLHNRSIDMHVYSQHKIFFHTLADIFHLVLKNLTKEKKIIQLINYGFLVINLIMVENEKEK